MNEEETEKETIDEKPQDQPSTSKKRKAETTPVIPIPGTSRVDANESTTKNSSHEAAWIPSFAPKKMLSEFRQGLESLGFDEDLYVLHEIALDPSFKIEDLPKNPFAAVVEVELKRAYWDILKEELEKEPPIFEHAFKVLLEVREFARDKIIFRTSTGPGAQAIMRQLEAVIDENTLRNQIEQGVFDFKVVVRNICDLLAKLCAPARDSEVENLRKEGNMFLALKGVFALMENIERDITNFFIGIGHSDLVKQTQAKELQHYLTRRIQDGDSGVRQWLKSSMQECASPSISVDDPSSSPGSRSPTSKRLLEDPKEKMRRITSRGYVRLIESDNPTPFPETMRIDTMKLAAFAEKFLQLTICTGSIWITFDVAGKEFSRNMGETMKNDLIIISNDIEESKLALVVEQLAEQCVKKVNEWATAENRSDVLEKLDSIRQQVIDLKRRDHPVRKLIYSRVARLVEAILSGTWNREFPSILAPIQLQLTAFALKFARLCSYNRETFADVYIHLIRELEETVQPTSSLEK